MALLEVKDLEVNYGLIKAVKGVSFEVNEGEIVTLIGANGAGKSTILKTVSGLLRSKTGSIAFEGSDISHLPSHKVVKHGLAHVPEGRRVFTRMTVQENLEMGGFTNKSIEKEDLNKGSTIPLFYGLYDYVQQNLPHTLVPISYGFDLCGAGAELVGVENFIMWTFTEPDIAHKLIDTYVGTSINGADILSDKYGMAMLIVGSILANNDIFSDEMVEEFSAKKMHTYVDQCFRRGAGPQVFYHLCGNHETDYKVFKKNLVWSPFNVLEIGYMGQNEFPAELLKNEFQDVTTIMPGVDTKLMINPNPKKVYERAKEVVLAGRDAKKGFILGTTCETPPYTIPGNLLALTRAARDFGTYGTW